MTTLLIAALFFALFTKHFICDFLMQWKYQYLNKGIYLHPGGLLHAQICMVGTLVALQSTLYFSNYIAFGDFYTNRVVFGAAFVESVIHYHIDWAKMNINSYYKLGPLTSEKFWWLLGLDQYLHYLCYVGIVAYLISAL